MVLKSSDFKGTEDKKWSVGFTWRIKIGQQPGYYKIIELPVGWLKVNFNESGVGIITYGVKD